MELGDLEVAGGVVGLELGCGPDVGDGVHDVVQSHVGLGPQLAK